MSKKYLRWKNADCNGQNIEWEEMSGKDFIDAVQIAMGFTCECVEKTAASETDRKYGLCFEPQLVKLIKAVK